MSFLRCTILKYCPWASMLHVCFVKKCSGSVRPRGSKVRGSKYDPPQGSKFQSCQNQNLIADLDSSQKSSKRKYSSFFSFLILSGSKLGSKVTSDPNLTSWEIKNKNTDNPNSETSFGIFMKNELIVITVIFKFSQKMSVKNVIICHDAQQGLNRDLDSLCILNLLRKNTSPKHTYSI